MSSTTSNSATDTFVAYRSLLFTVAYEMLGSAVDAEDVLQETWMRWAQVDVKEVHDHRAYLVRITTRQALNRLRTMKRRRESYIGPWLPEPLLTTPDVADDIELAESLSTALMLVLETLAPTERAVFVLREVFDISYAEIAAAVGKTPVTVRQIASRARQHVEARRPRAVVSPARARAALESFRKALQTGDPQGLLDVLAPDVVLLTDGGGIKTAARVPIDGIERVLRNLLVGFGKISATLSVEPVVVNGNPALALRWDDEVGVMTFRMDGNRITGLYFVRNPEKLAHLDSLITVTVR